MAQYDHDVYDYMVEDYDPVDFDDGDDELQAARERVSLESDPDSDDEPTNASDTTAAEARRGKDIQGIPWSRLQFTREKYRIQRLQQYKNYENLNQSHEGLDKECKSPSTEGKFYQFRYNTRSVKSTYVHFQLRNLVWATSKHDVYLMHSFTVTHWSPMTRRGTEVLNVHGPVMPVSEAQRNPWAYSPLGRVQISTMCVKDNLLVAGGYQGEMVCKYLDRPGVSYCAKITHDENAITNAIEIYDNARYVPRKIKAIVRADHVNEWSNMLCFCFIQVKHRGSQVSTEQIGESTSIQGCIQLKDVNKLARTTLKNTLELFSLVSKPKAAGLLSYFFGANKLSRDSSD